MKVVYTKEQKQKAIKTSKKDTLSVEQVRILFESLKVNTEKDARDYAMINLLIRTGLRNIEISRANIEDIHELSGVTVLDVQGKGRTEKDNYVVLSKEALSPIDDYLNTWRKDEKSSAPLFASTANRNRGGRITTRAISGIVKEAFRAIGIDSSRITAHSLRHTAVTLSLIGGASVEEAQAMARHADISTTMVYAHHVNRLKNAAEEKISRVIDE